MGDNKQPSRYRLGRRVILWTILVLLTIIFVLTFSKARILVLALSGVTHNNQWGPVIMEIDGVSMALVPSGCFLMGSTDGDEDEIPVHEQCFDTPFWLDRTEVTYEQVGDSDLIRSQGEGDFIATKLDLNFARDTVDWFEATAFCESRSARLPSEAEWEYAARGPDGLMFTWGDDFIADNVAYRPGNTDSFYHRIQVGSYPLDQSWVGAFDMTGNLWEWTSTIYAPYPYVGTDGREVDLTLDNKSPRVVRGGSWFRANEIYFRLANRFRPPPDRFHNDGGFRCARSFFPDNPENLPIETLRHLEEIIYFILF